MVPEYRIIDFKGMYCTLENFVQVVHLLESAEWKAFPTVYGKLVGIYPERYDQMHTDQAGIQVFSTIAPYLVDGGEAIFEIARDSTPWEKVWLHLLYKDGKVEKRETPAHQWQV